MAREGQALVVRAWGNVGRGNGACIFGKKIITPSKELVQAMDDADKGLFKPDRENDELTRALWNAEHRGRTRGKGDVPWNKGFPEHEDTYRSRQRKKDREANRFMMFERALREQQKQLDELKQKTSQGKQSPVDCSAAAPSQRKSSVASTELQADDHALMDDAPTMPRYPMDDITENTSCELRSLMKNISFKVAVGSAFPCAPRATYHCKAIPAGYARVTVDEVMNGFEDLDLDIALGDGETKLGDVKRQIFLWKKADIQLPGWAPRPPSPPLLEMHDRSPSPSPTPPRDPTPPREPTPPTKSAPSTASMFQGQKRKTISTKLSSMPPTTKSKKAKKAKEPPKKLPYEMTEEETKEEVDAYVKAFVAPKKPPPKFVVPDKAREHWVEILERPSKYSPRTDYDRHGCH